MKCPKCGGEMEEGVIGDQSTNLNTPFQPVWGTSIKKVLLGFNQKLENKREIKTYRCKSCGYLESYAK